MKEKLVLFDMDGVLCGFDADFTRRTGRTWDHNGQWTKAEKWEMISKHPFFFRDLPWVPGAKAMFQFVRYAESFTGYAPGILSAMSQHIPESKEQKGIWLSREIGDNVMNPEHVHIVAHREEKVQLVGPKRILVDDHVLNIEDWNNAGGIGIFFNDAVQVIEDLQAILGTPQGFYDIARIYADKDLDPSDKLVQWVRNA